MRRRGRGNNNRKPNHHQHHHHHHQGRNQTFDSNGPGVRLRGTAHQIYEKYLTLARDAASSGDRIMSENYFQHADHYYRHILASQGPLPEFQERNDGPEAEMESDGSGFGQGEQPPMTEQAQPGFQPQSQPVQTFNGAPSDGAPLPGPSQPRNEGARNEGEGQNFGQQGGNPQGGHQGGQGGNQGQHNQFRRDRFNNRRFRNDRGGQGGFDRNDRRDDRQGQGQGGERRDNRNDNYRNDFRGDNRGENRNEYRGDNRGNRDNRDNRDNRPPRRSEDEAFEPPAFLKADRPQNETPPPRDPFNRDDEQN
jgi:hypothetical protein